MQQDDQEWTRQYSMLLDAKIATLRAMPEATRLALRQQWLDLVEEIRRSLGEDPAGPQARALADRWTGLLRQVSGAVDPAWAEFLRSPGQRSSVERYAATLPADAAARGDGPWRQFIDPEVWNFIRKAIEAGRTGS